MSAAALALRHGRALLFIAVCAAAAGLAAGYAMPKGIYPEVTFPREQVVASLPGAPAATVLAGVTRPLEAQLSSVPGVQRVKSRTIRGAAELSLFFAPDVDMAQAHPLVLARIAEARGAMPPSADVVAERVLPSSFPILSLNVEGPYPASTLYELAEYTLRPALSGLPGVGLVAVQSSDVPEIEVLLDATRLEAAHLTVPDVADRLKSANTVQAVARLDAAHELSIGVVTGELASAADIEAVVVGGTPAQPLRVADVGHVVERAAPRTTLIRVDGQPGPIINVARRLGGDTLALDAAVLDTLASLKPTLPPGVVVRPVYEQAEFVADGVKSVRDAVLIGALLAVLVLAVFLRDLRATLLAAVSLPLTLAASLLAMRALGQTLNLMSLGGLAVAVGLVIDDAVVVIEAVHKHLEAGLPPREAAQRGTDELFWPVVGTTATTVVVFLPLGLLSGVAGQFFVALSLSLASAVVLSLPIALAVLPALAAAVLRPVKHASAGKRLADLYARALEATIDRPALVLGAAALLVAAGAWCGTQLASDFLPEADEGAYVIDYFTPVGTSMAEADRMAAKIEDVLRATPEVLGYSRRLGAELGPPVATLASRGDVAVRLKKDRKRDIDEIMDEQRGKLAGAVPGMRIEFVQVLQDMLGDLQGSPEPVEVKVIGPEHAVLQGLAATMARRLDGIPGLVDRFDGDEGCAPELDLRVEPLEAGRRGLTAQAIGDQVEAAFLGEIATQLRRPTHLENVRVSADHGDASPDGSTTPDAIDRVRVSAPGGAALPLASVARKEPQCPPAALLRENQQNLVHLTARLSGTDLGSAVTAVRARLKDLRLPPGYSWQVGGLSEQQSESFQSLAVALLVALGAVTAVLLFQLRSVRSAIAVLAATPLALAGGAATLLAAHIALNVSSMMGAILLVGLVVKNGILLLDHALVAEEAGASHRAALLDAARARVRPILMTTLATLAALVPLVLGIGAGSELQRPLAVAVVGGLAFSTAATLLVVPALALALRRDQR